MTAACRRLTCTPQLRLAKSKERHRANYVTTHVDSKVVAAYYSLVYAALDQKRVPAKLVKGMGKYDIPVMLLARLAVDHREQGKGLGKALLKDAVLRPRFRLPKSPV